MSDQNNILFVLQQTCSPDQNVRVPATQYLEGMAETQLPEFLQALATVLADDSNPETVRQMAGLQIKNQLTSKDDVKRMHFQQRWAQMDPNLRLAIKRMLLSTLSTSYKTVGSTSAMAVAAIAQIELPSGQWGDLMATLCTNATMATSTEPLKQATLETIGYICEDIDPAVLASMSDNILTAIVNNMKREEPSNGVKLAATNALLNSLEFVKKNFGVPDERNFIMQVVCETTQASDVKVVVRAYQCLVRIMSLYYDYMGYYMQEALFQLTMSAMNSEEEDIALQAIEFWSTVCDEELEMIMMGEEGQQTQCRHFAKMAIEHLCPLLMLQMTKQEDTDDDDIWNPATAAAVCLGLLANVCESHIVQYVIPFVSANISHTDWHYREAAVLAFGEIMDGPSPQDLADICRQAVPVLAQLLTDPSVHVKDSSAYAMSRVCEFQASVILQRDMLAPVVEALCNQISDVPRVAVNICWAFNNLFAAAYELQKDMEDSDTVETYPLSGFFQVIVSNLIQTTTRPDSTHCNLRHAAYEALNQAIINSSEDCYAVVQSTTLYLMTTLQNTLQMQPGMAQSDRATHSELQSLLCGSLQAAAARLRKEDLIQISQQLMEMLIYMVGTTAGMGGVQEDALLAINAIINSLELDFAPFVQPLLGSLVACLHNHREVEVCINAVGIVSDLARVLQADFTPVCRQIMEVLIGCVMDLTVDRQVKVVVLSALGDIASGVGPQFVDYLEFAIPMLKAAAETNIEAVDYDSEEYILQLRENILEGYSGIVCGLKGEKRPWNAEVYRLQDSVPSIVAFIQKCNSEQCNTDAIVRGSVGLLGDLCEVFTKDMHPLINHSWVRRLLNEGKASENSTTKKTSIWASK
eukprot:Ihof_evm1s466 gene=Ihof_evmTU1s466